MFLAAQRLYRLSSEHRSRAGFARRARRARRERLSLSDCCSGQRGQRTRARNTTRVSSEGADAEESMRAATSRPPTKKKHH